MLLFHHDFSLCLEHAFYSNVEKLMLSLLYTPFPKSKLQWGVSLWLRLWCCRKSHPCADSLWHCAEWAETPFQSSVSSTDHSPILYWILTDAFWELTLQWGCVVGAHKAKANVRMEQLWLTVGVCWRGFIGCFRMVLLLQGSLVGTKETCIVEGAAFPSLLRWFMLLEKFRKGVWTEVCCVQSCGF